jgi:hypothetical protein
MVDSLIKHHKQAAQCVGFVLMMADSIREYSLTAFTNNKPFIE